MNHSISAAAPLSPDAWTVLDRAVRRASQAAAAFRHSGAAERCRLLELIAFQLDARQASLAATAGIAAAKPGASTGEHTTTTAYHSAQQQLTAFCAALRGSPKLGAATETAPAGQHMERVPVGPVAVLCAENGSLHSADVIAALAAGCPVLVCCTSIQTGYCALQAGAVAAALRAAGLPEGVYTLLENTPGTADALIAHPAIKAAAFSGSRAQALQLTRRNLDRSEPLTLLLDPLGGNPVFVLPHALNARAEHLGQQLLKQYASAAPSVLKPGIVVAIRGDGYIDLRETIIDGLMALRAPAQACDELELDAASLLATPELAGAAAAAGPAGMLVPCDDAAEMLAVAALLDWQHVAGLHMDQGDSALAARLMPQLERMARHVGVNSFAPTPQYNAATAARALGRFLRPASKPG